VNEGRRPWKAAKQMPPKTPRLVLPPAVRFTIPLLIGAAAGVHYGPAWAVGGAAAVLSWLVPLWLKSHQLLSAQLAHPRAAFAVFSYVLATLWFPFLAILIDAPGNQRYMPAVLVPASAGLSVMLTALCWPSQMRFARMRASAALDSPAQVLGQDEQH
jgi:hypothetical protein